MIIKSQLMKLEFVEFIFSMDAASNNIKTLDSYFIYHKFVYTFIGRVFIYEHIYRYHLFFL